MKKTMLLVALMLLIGQVFSQQIVELTENKPFEYNGLQYGYYIGNESSKEIKGEDYDRYEINLYVTNNSSCIKLIPFKSSWTSSSGSTSSSDDIQIAEFNCLNATGKKLTPKKGSVNAKPWYTSVRVRDETTKDKYKTVYGQVGYAIRSGQTITTRIIVIVPKGEKPKFNCRIIYLPEIQ
jgi:hypothetical protein